MYVCVYMVLRKCSFGHAGRLVILQLLLECLNVSVCNVKQNNIHAVSTCTVTVNLVQASGVDLHGMFFGVFRSITLKNRSLTPIPCISRA